MAQSGQPGQRTFSIRQRNRRRLLLSLLGQQPISRVRLAGTTGLSTTTITNLTSELANEGVIEEIGVDEIAQSQGAGRPPVALQLVANSRHAVGIHIGVRSVRVALCNLMAEVLARDDFAIHAHQSPRTVIERIAKTVTNLRVHSGQATNDLVGVGIGASGLVDDVTGVNRLAPNLGWRDVPLRDMLCDALDLPVAVDNNVRYMALAESMYGAGRTVRALAFVYARVGLAAGLVVDGKIYRGAGNGAGEIGHWVMAPLGPNNGKPTTLEDLLSERTLVRLAHDVAPDTMLGARSRETSEISVLLAAAREGNMALRTLLAEHANYLGIAMANLVDVLDPELLILGGYLADAFDLLQPTLSESMRRHAFAGMADKVALLPSSYGVLAGAVGAAVGALNQFFFGLE